MFLALKEKNQKDYLLSKKEIRFLLFIQKIRRNRSIHWNCDFW
ncbi:MAG: hypothetical protein ACLTBV_18780 [Enterocloster bolteae]